MSDEGYLCRCPKCGHEERTGLNPLRDGWPTCPCHGGSMTLVDNERFKAAIDRQMGEIFAPVELARVAAEDRAATVRLYGEEHVARLEAEANRG